MELDYSEHDHCWPRREQTIRNVLEKCGGRFLLACKGCYEVEPRVVAEFDPDSSVTKCECCEGTSVIFLHESTTEDGSGRKFYEYQVIRERLSEHSKANAYCKHRSTCDSGEKCKYVHTYYEMLIWRMESVQKGARASRKNLARYFGEYQGQKFHCPHCCMNFEDNLKSNLKDKFHLHMQRHTNGHIPKDGTWKYKPCRTTLPQRCLTSENDCECENAHSEKELVEWKTRKLITDARNSFVEETPTVDYLTRLHDRMIDRSNLKEIKNSSDTKIFEMERKEVSWRFSWQLPNSLKGKLQYVSFLQPAFMLRHNGGYFGQHLAVSNRNLEKVDIEIKFKNPGIFGQYTGTLLFDFGDDTTLFATNFNVAIRGEGHADQTCYLEILNQNWSTNRIVIPYPDETTGEVQYEENVRELEKKYKIPRVESLDDVYLEDLNPANYAKQMHNFLYKEELARQALLSRLNIECELKVSEHVFIESGSFIGSQNDGSLYAAFTSPMRLSIDSDEGVLIRDSCSKVLIGQKEESALAYECEIVQWENNDVYLRIPPRCIKDLGLQKDQSVVLVVQYKLNRSQFCQRHFAIDSLQERINVICPLPQMYATLDNSSVHSQYLDETQNSVLRQIQAEKVRKRRGRIAKCYPPLVVAGPFGTGKTHTIRNVILEILQQNGTDSRILLCTHSNSAADLYIKDIVHDHLWKPWTDKILRVMYHRRRPATVLVQEVIDFCLFSDDKTTFRYPTLSELRKYRIVITTFSTSLALGQLGAGLRTGAFTRIFLDEASQAMEPEVIMPLSLANCETTRIIIAGDHRQINERMFLSDNVKIPTLLERMYNAYNENYRQHRILLCNNYRCVDGLLQLISKLFYKENILKSTGDAELVPGYDPVHFVHVQGECTETDAGDFINVSEAYQVISEVKELIKLVDPTDIMVTTPHRSQVQLIRDLLKRNRLRRITVYAARNVQALQFRVVILSSVLRRIVCLRSGGKNWGFLSDSNLLNTVVTRAKSLVIAVGDTVTLCSTGSCAEKWETFMEHCERSGTIHPEHVNVQMIKSEVRLARQNLRIEAQEFVPSRELNIETTSPQPGPRQACLGLIWPATPKSLPTPAVDDPILDDMWLKSIGKLPPITNDRGNQIMEYGLHLEDTDPNEIDINPSEKYAGKEAIFPKHSVGELEAMLEEQPDLYKRCRLNIKSWCTAEAVPVASSDGHNSDSIIHLTCKSNLGRTFDQDEVVVKILKKEQKRTECKFYGQVMGILKRHQNPRQRYFMCQPDELNLATMAPIEKSCTKFAIKTQKDQGIKNPGMISVFKIDYTRGNSYVGLKLVSCSKIDWSCTYAVRYLRWAEYHPYPFGYVAEVVSLQDQRRCRELEFGLSGHVKQSVVSQVQKTEVPLSNPSDVIEAFTIDPEGAKDLDDALSLQDCGEHKNCFLFGVHITDVATVLPKDSPVDLEARKQGETFYGSNETVHMLPVELSTRKCSLLQGETRPTISTFFHTTIKPPHITGCDGHNEPEKCFVRSAKQMTYKEAECIIASTRPSGKALDAKIKKVWEILWDWRVARLGGAAYFKKFNSYRELLEEGRAHLLIEEAMLAFNANTANYLVSKGFNIHLRVQPLPRMELWEKWLFSNYRSIANSSYLTASSDYIRGKHERLRLFTRALAGHKEIQIPPKVSVMNENISDNNGNYNMPDLTREMKRCLRSSSVKDWVEMYAPVWYDISERIRSGDVEIVFFLIAMDKLHPSQVSALDQYHHIQKKPDWITTLNGDTLHSSLRLLRYTQCTSPIRRYPDIVIQRCIHRALDGKRPTLDTGQVHRDDHIRKMKYKFEVAELAKILKEQPSVLVVCISMITDAGVKICFSLQDDCIPPRVRELDYAHLMVDLKEKDMLEGRNEQDIRRNHAGDIILDQIRASWKFRFYDYAKHLNENATKLAPKSKTEENLTVRIPHKQWKAIVDTMTAVTEQSGSKKARMKRRNELKSALNGLSCEPQVSSSWDQMCGETRNNPIPVRHHRELKKRLLPGSVIQIQLFSWLGKNGLAEPCVQLLKLAPDMDVCIHHNREPLHVFAYDAKAKENNPASLKKYRTTWEPLIRLDSAYSAVTDGSSIVLKGIKIAWNMVRDVDINDHEASASSQISDHRFKMEAAFCEERYISFNINDLLCLRLSGVPNTSDTSFTLLDRKHPVYTIVLHGAVTSVEGGAKKKSKASQRSRKITVVFKIFEMHAGNNDVFRNQENQWTVEVIPLSFMHRHLQSSLRKLARTKNELIGNIALKRAKMERVGIPDEAQVLLWSENLPGFPFPLNGNQKRERNRSMQNKFTLIQGPPGTGKSYLGAHIAATFSLINKTRDPENPSKVLYCGPSNKAVDVAARFLKDCQNVKVVRMYSASLEEKIYPNPLRPKPVIQSPGEDTKTPDPELYSIALHKLIRQRTNNWSEAIRKFDADVRNPTKRFTRKEVDSYKAMITKAKIEELKSCDIIVCTCSLSTLLYDLKDEADEMMEFAQCIIDECGMCSEPETMLPIIVANPEQVVLIGDHKQLQPVIKCKKAERLGLGESLFSNYSNMAGMLEVQYRMDPVIMKYPSNAFYDGRLSCDVSIEKRKEVTFFQHSSKNNVFWNVKGTEKQQKFRSIRGGHKSKYNMEEAGVVIKLLVHLTSSAKLKPSDIMVLSPYTAQCTRIQGLINKERSQLKAVHVGTIVTSQGSEADFVILSTVRSMLDEDIQDDPSRVWKQRHLGFVCDPHQINVGLTRARRGLCIIGNKNLLQVDELWKELIESYDARDAIHSVSTQTNTESEGHFLNRNEDDSSRVWHDIHEEEESDEEDEDSDDSFLLETDDFCRIQHPGLELGQKDECGDGL